MPASFRSGAHSNPNAIDISLVVPVYNEEESIDAFILAVLPIFERLQVTWEAVFVNDGSVDNTLAVIRKTMTEWSNVRVIDLSRNFGKEAALTAGLDYAQGACVIPIDVDLQDPPDVVEEMIAKWREGYDVVCAVRGSRRSDSYLKSATARVFYHVYNKMSEVKILNDGGDFRLLDRGVVEVLKQLPERTRFMKGLFSWVGFRTTVIYYERAARARGTTKFSYWKLWNFAIDGMTSFSTIPLRVWSYLGALVALVAFLSAVYLVARTLMFGVDVPGYASLMVVVLFLGGIQLVSLGIIGEYLGRTLQEVKGRPIYIVRDALGFSIGPILETNGATSTGCLAGSDDQLAPAQHTLAWGSTSISPALYEPDMR